MVWSTSGSRTNTTSREPEGAFLNRARFLIENKEGNQASGGTVTM